MRSFLRGKAKMRLLGHEMRSFEAVNPKMSAMIFYIRNLLNAQVFQMRSFLRGKAKMRLLGHEMRSFEAVNLKMSA